MPRFALAVLAGVVFLAAPAVRAQLCPADCDGDGSVEVNELISCVGILLAGGPTTSCPPCDTDGDGVVAINEIIAGVNSALAGCTVGDLPNLVPVSVHFRSMTPECINDTTEIQLQLEVCVANQGTADSGPFNIRVLGEPFSRVNSLAAGAEMCVRGAFVPFSIDVQVDADGEVVESDELDNFDSFFVPQPSPPPFCTATPTITETPDLISTATATASDTDTPTAGPSPTPTETAVPAEAPTTAETPAA